jgi:general secretion pathway protein F
MLYQVKAVRGEAEIVVLPIEAVDAKDAERRTLDQGYDVLAVTQNRFALGKLKLGSDKFPVLMFTQELVALLEAGLNLVAALEALGEKETRTPGRSTTATTRSIRLPACRTRGASPRATPTTR